MQTIAGLINVNKVQVEILYGSAVFAIAAVIDKVLAENGSVVASFRSGKTKAFQALFGACMRELRGAGSPAAIKAMLEKRLAN